MFFNIYENGFNIRTNSGKKTTDKQVQELARWVINKFIKPIETRIKLWTHGQPYTGEIGEADFLMDKLNLNWNNCQFTRGIDGLIKRSQRDGAMQLIKFIRNNPEYLEYLTPKK